MSNGFLHGDKWAARKAWLAHGAAGSPHGGFVFRTGQNAPSGCRLVLFTSRLGVSTNHLCARTSRPAAAHGRVWPAHEAAGRAHGWVGSPHGWPEAAHG